MEKHDVVHGGIYSLVHLGTDLSRYRESMGKTIGVPRNCNQTCIYQDKPVHIFAMALPWHSNRNFPHNPIHLDKSRMIMVILVYTRILVVPVYTYIKQDRSSSSSHCRYCACDRPGGDCWTPLLSHMTCKRPGRKCIHSKF